MRSTNPDKPLSNAAAPEASATQESASGLPPEWDELLSLVSRRREELRSALTPDGAAKLAAARATRAVFEDIQERMLDGRMAIQWNGHFQEGRQFRTLEHQSDMSEMLSLMSRLDQESGEALRDAIASGKPLDEYVTLGSGGRSCQCSNCGERMVFETNGAEARVADPCVAPKGVYPIQVELNVPSGKLVIANDLRHWFPIFGEYDINNDAGIAKATKKNAEFGMAYCFVGNTSPSVYQLEDGSLTISATPPSAAYNESTRKFEALSAEALAALTPPGRKIGTISTTLWWWSGVDHDEFRRRFKGSGEQFARVLKEYCHVVSIEPGVYRISANSRNAEETVSGAPYHFANIERVRDVDPSLNYRERLDIDLSAGQVLRRKLHAVPSLYLQVTKEKGTSENDPDAKILKLLMSSNLSEQIDREMVSLKSEQEFGEYWASMTHEDQIASIASAANCIFGGYDHVWHDRGWPMVDPELHPGLADFSVPLLTGRHSWYEIRPGDSALLLMAGMYEADNAQKIFQYGKVTFAEGEPLKVNQSFRDLAFNVLQCIVRYGSRGLGGNPEEQSWYEQRTVDAAKVALVRLSELYPNDVPEYCKDLSEALRNKVRIAEINRRKRG